MHKDEDWNTAFNVVVEKSQKIQIAAVRIQKALGSIHGWMVFERDRLSFLINQFVQSLSSLKKSIERKDSISIKNWSEQYTTELISARISEYISGVNGEEKEIKDAVGVIVDESEILTEALSIIHAVLAPLCK